MVAFLTVDGSSPKAADNDDGSTTDNESVDNETSYEQMYCQWVDMVKQVKQLTEKNSFLSTQNCKLDSEVTRLLREVE